MEEAVKNNPDILFYENKYPVGTLTPSGDTLRQLMIRFGLLCESREKMMEDLAYLNQRIAVLDDCGRNMVIKMDPERLLTDFQNHGR